MKFFGICDKWTLQCHSIINHTIEKYCMHVRTKLEVVLNAILSNVHERTIFRSIYRRNHIKYEVKVMVG